MSSAHQKTVRQRFCLAPECRALFFVCADCDRGQAYCDDSCRRGCRATQQREARAGIRKVLLDNWPIAIGSVHALAVDMGYTSGKFEMSAAFQSIVVVYSWLEARTAPGLQHHTIGLPICTAASQIARSALVLGNPRSI
jgi:hypothetical protein